MLAWDVAVPDSLAGNGGVDQRPRSIDPHLICYTKYKYIAFCESPAGNKTHFCTVITVLSMEYVPVTANVPTEQLMHSW